MKKNLTLLAIIVCCAFACSSTNCFAQIKFVSSGLEACSKGLRMAAVTATVHYKDYKENLGRKVTANLERQIAAANFASRMAVATWTPAHNSTLSSGKGIKSYHSKIKELLLSTEKSKQSIIRMTAVELSPFKYIKGDSLPHTKDFKMRQLAAEAEEWTAPKGQVTSPQNPDNR